MNGDNGLREPGVTCEHQSHFKEGQVLLEKVKL